MPEQNVCVGSHLFIFHVIQREGNKKHSFYFHQKNLIAVSLASLFSVGMHSPWLVCCGWELTPFSPFTSSSPPPHTQESGCRPPSRPCCRAARLKGVQSCPLPSGWWAPSSPSWGRPLGESSTSTRGSLVLSTPPSSGSWCSRREMPRPATLTTHGRPGVTSRHHHLPHVWPEH